MEAQSLPRAAAIITKRIRFTFQEPQDDYCYICDDGGLLVVCETCPRACCYEEQVGDEASPEEAPLEQEDLSQGEISMPPTPNVPLSEEAAATQESTSLNEISAVHEPCVSLPPGFLKDKNSVFICPECLSRKPFANVNYTPNRGSRNTMRTGTRASVIIVLFHLGNITVVADALMQQLTAMLGGFEIEVFTLQKLLSRKIKPEEQEELEKIKEPFHLVALILTEGTPGGGWWWADSTYKGGKQQAQERNLLEQRLGSLSSISLRARSARLFVSACGIGLSAPNVIQEIHDEVDKQQWHSIVMPSAGVICPPDFLSIFPELFVQLYYMGASLRSSLLRVWGKSDQARVHTGLVVIERAKRLDNLTVFKYEFAPPASRPLGVELPSCWVCGCGDATGQWHEVHTKFAYGERFSYLRSTCCRMELHVAIFQARRRIVSIHGTTIMAEEWDPDSKKFTFDRSTMVTMKLTSPRSQKHRKTDPKARHDRPWTILGQQAHP